MKRLIAIALLVLCLCSCSNLDAYEVKGDTDKTVNSTDKGSVLYVANRSSLTYHLSSCYIAKRISNENRYEAHGFRALQEKGYTPCKSCIDK